jgi:hypothetical protein
MLFSARKSRRNRSLDSIIAFQRLQNSFATEYPQQESFRARLESLILTLTVSVLGPEGGWRSNRLDLGGQDRGEHAYIALS